MWPPQGASPQRQEVLPQMRMAAIMMSPGAERSLTLAKATREVVHAHARNVRLIRSYIVREADRAAARQAAE